MTVRYVSILGVEDNVSRRCQYPRRVLALRIAVGLPEPGLVVVSVDPARWALVRVGRILGVRVRPGGVVLAEEEPREVRLAGLVAQRVSEGLLPRPEGVLRSGTLLGVRVGPERVGDRVAVSFDVEVAGVVRVATGFCSAEELAGYAPGIRVRVRGDVLWPDLELVDLGGDPLGPHLGRVRR